MPRRFWGAGPHTHTNVASDFPTGVYLVWGDDTMVADNDFIRGGQISVNWADVETARNQWDWSSLTQQLAYYASIGKPATVQLESSTKPTWIYSQPNINKCGTFTAGGATWDIPRYWEPLYMTLMQEVLSALAEQIRTSPYKDSVLAVRCSPNLIGTEQFDLSDSRATITDQTVFDTWTVQVGQDCYQQVMQLCSDTFMPDIRHFLRSKLFATFNTDPTLRTNLLGQSKGWIFGTNGNPDLDLPQIDNFFYEWASSGLTRGYYESTGRGSSYSHPLSWVYWRQLLELSRGISYIATYADDLSGAVAGQPNDTEYQAAFAFSNTYAGYQSQAAVSPGAFIAFRGGTKSTDDNYSFLINQYGSDGTVGGDSSTVAIDSNAGASIIGPTTQRFGRFARRTDIANGKNSFYLRLDSTFRASLSDSVAVHVYYLDSGSSSWTLRWGSTVAEQQSVTKTNSGNWKTATFTVPSTSLTGNLTAASDLLLTATASDTTFHMVEVIR